MKSLIINKNLTTAWFILGGIIGIITLYLYILSSGTNMYSVSPQTNGTPSQIASVSETPPTIPLENIPEKSPEQMQNDVRRAFTSVIVFGYFLTIFLIYLGITLIVSIIKFIIFPVYKK